MSHSLTYLARANQHRPEDSALLVREARRLQASGLKPRDIAQALRLPLQFIEAYAQQATQEALQGHDASRPMPTSTALLQARIGRMRRSCACCE